MNGWLVLGLAACEVAPAVVAEEARIGLADPGVARPDVVLVLVQHLRHDARPDGGSARFLDALGQEGGQRYAVAYSQSPSPTVSFGSLLTGHYPSAIPLCDVGDWLGGRQFGQELPGVLGLYGYETALFARGQTDDGRLAWACGHRDLSPRVETDWVELREGVKAWWTAHGDGPRFLTVVVSDLDLRRRPALLARVGIGDPDAPEFLLVAAYEEEAARIGAQVGAMLDGLDGSPRIIVTSTAGANLGERTGLRNHGLGFFSQDYVVDRSVHVPLWTDDGESGETSLRTDPVELVDVFPTLAAWAQVTPSHGLPGQDLAVVDPGGHAHAEYGPMLAVRGGAHLLTLHRPMPDAAAGDPWITDVLVRTSPAAQRGDPGADYALHDVVVDPLQARQLLDELPDQATALHQALVACTDDPPIDSAEPESCAPLTLQVAQEWDQDTLLAGATPPDFGGNAGVGLGDLDGDGWLDAVIVTPEGSLGLRNDAVGGLQAAFDVPRATGVALVDLGGDTLTNIMGVGVADLNGDAALDYCFTDLAPSLTCLVSDGAGAFYGAGRELGLVPDVLGHPELPEGHQIEELEAFWTTWGLALQGLDNDGWLDLGTVSGGVPERCNVAFSPIPDFQPDSLFRGTAEGFVDESHTSAFHAPTANFGLVAGDFDGDGALDLVIGPHEGTPACWSNPCTPVSWLQVDLVGPL